MDEEICDAINRYCEHFSSQVQRIQSISGDSSDLFKRALFCSLLDALSRSVYPRKQPRDRFTSLVRRFGQWAHQDRVSLPHIVRLLQLTPDPVFEDLRKFSLEKIDQWKDSWGEIGLEQDPTCDEVSKYWPRNEEYRTPIKGIRLELLTHLQLLYSHRNFLFHEMRSPGYGIDTKEHDEPYYHELSAISNRDEPPIETIELVYPVKFFNRLCDNVLNGLKGYFKENQLNPFDYYDFGSYWIEELN